jgi:hypothetical protein
LPKRTFQPKVRRRHKTHGFRARMKSGGDARYWRRAARRDVISLRPSERGASAGGGLGFPRDARLLRRSDYEAVYRGGQRRSSPQFAIFYRANSLSRSRFGISVKKALGERGGTQPHSAPHPRNSAAQSIGVSDGMGHRDSPAPLGGGVSVRAAGSWSCGIWLQGVLRGARRGIRRRLRRPRATPR